jgi:hypothetical protein
VLSKNIPIIVSYVILSCLQIGVGDSGFMADHDKLIGPKFETGGTGDTSVG